MTTQRLYYDDSRTTDFTATIIDHLTLDGRPAVILDRTYFYPTGGGQPHDTGQIGGVEVVEVTSRKDDGAVIHFLSAEPPQGQVGCRIDRSRRFDLMQHHTGQHILTRSFEQIAHAHTTSFHLSADSVTIDLDQSDLSPELIDQVEDLANQIVYENRPVTARIVDPNQIDDVRIRKMPDVLTTDGLRVVEIEDFDRTACGGTHVRRTGEIGLIKIMGLPKRGEQTRVEFRCGWRALREFRARQQVIGQLAADLTVGYWELPQAIARLNDDLRSARQALRTATDRLLKVEASDLLQTARMVGDVRLITYACEGRDPSELRALANHLIAAPEVIALLGVAGANAHLIAARHPTAPGDMSALLKHALSSLGTDRGGGRPDFAQGGGVSADIAEIQSALDAAATLLSGTA